MINNILFIALVVLAVTEVMFAVGFFMMLSKIKELNFDYKFFKSVLETDRDITNGIMKTVAEQAETYEHMYELVDNLCDQFTSMQTIHSDIYEQYRNILEQYEVIHKSYVTVNENYKTIIKYWKDVTNASDAASEEFRLCALELKRYADILAPWVIDSDQLGDEAVNGIKFTVLDPNGENPFLKEPE